MTGFGEAERVAGTETGARTVWRRLKLAGARTLGLGAGPRGHDSGKAVAERTVRGRSGEDEVGAAGDAVAVGADGLNERDDADEGGDAAYGGQKPQGYRGVLEGKQAGGRKSQGEQFAIRGADGEGEELAHQDEGAVQDWDIRHASRSVAATVFAASVLLAASLLGPEGPRGDCLVAGAGLYAGWLAGSFAMECWGCARGYAPVPAVLADTRFGLGAVALLLLWSGETEALGLAGWVGAAAFGVGGMADGGWIAVVSLRREVPPWRALAVVHRESRDAWRAGWRVIYGGTFR